MSYRTLANPKAVGKRPLAAVVVVGRIDKLILSGAAGHLSQLI